MLPALADGALDHLRRVVADIEPASAASFTEDAGVLALGLPAADAALQGGLAFGALHELAPATPAQFGAAAGFALALAAKCAPQGAANGKDALLIQTDFAALEAGGFYGPGLDLFGLDMERLLVLRVPRPLDALWAFEEALKSRALAVTLAELPDAGPAADLTATRRLTLAARAGGGLGLLLRQRRSPLPTAAMTRWEVGSAVSRPDRFGGLGRTAFDLSLCKNRCGRCGRFLVCWNHDERTFVPAALSLGVVETTCDRSAVARPLAHAG